MKLKFNQFIIYLRESNACFSQLDYIVYIKQCPLGEGNFYNWVNYLLFFLGIHLPWKNIDKNLCDQSVVGNSVKFHLKLDYKSPALQTLPAIPHDCTYQCLENYTKN
jgi:hypothetical protein